MKRMTALAVVAAIAMPAAAGAQAPGEGAAAQMQAADASQIIQDWPQVARSAAEDMMAKYGQPDEVTASRLIWHENRPWLRTVVYREEVDHDFPMPHKDVLEQFVPYDVPPDKFDELAAYDGSVIAERTKGELSARCDREAANFLALNLADDIINDRKTVGQARQEYADAIRGVMAGNPPETTQALQFQPPPVQQARDSDVAVIEQAEVPE